MTSMTSLWYCAKRFPIAEYTEVLPGFRNTGRKKKYDRHHENSEGGAGKLEHLYEAVSVGNGLAVLAASISILEKFIYLKQNDI